MFVWCVVWMHGNMFSVIGGDLSIICWGKTLCETFLPILVVGIYTTAHCPKFLNLCVIIPIFKHRCR